MIIPYGIINGVSDEPEVNASKPQLRDGKKDEHANFSSLLAVFLGDSEECEEILPELASREQQKKVSKTIVSNGLSLAMSAVHSHLPQGTLAGEVNEESIVREASMKQFDAAGDQIIILQELLSKGEDVDDGLLELFLTQFEGVVQGQEQSNANEITIESLLAAFRGVDKSFVEAPKPSEISDALELTASQKTQKMLLGQETHVVAETPIMDENFEWPLRDKGLPEEIDIAKKPTLRQLKQVSQNQLVDNLDSESEPVTLLEENFLSFNEENPEQIQFEESTMDPEVIPKIDSTSTESNVKVEIPRNYAPTRPFVAEMAEDENEPIQFGENPKIQSEKADKLDDKEPTLSRDIIPSRERKPTFELGDVRTLENPYKTDSFITELTETTDYSRKILDLQEENALPKIAESIQTLIQEDRSEVRIELKPDHLGDMKIKLSLERGIMVAEFIVENEAVKEIIASQLPQLHTALQEQGAQVGEMMVNIGFENKGQDEQPFSRPRQFHQRTTMRASGTITNEGKSTYLSRTPWNQVDLKV